MPDINISIHAAREGGDAFHLGLCAAVTISIHAAREGGDQQAFRRVLSVGISIHAAREGGDIWAICFSGDDSYFNPRRP